MKAITLIYETNFIIIYYCLLDLISYWLGYQYIIIGLKQIIGYKQIIG